MPFSWSSVPDSFRDKWVSLPRHPVGGDPCEGALYQLTEPTAILSLTGHSLSWVLPSPPQGLMLPLGMTSASPRYCFFQRVLSAATATMCYYRLNIPQPPWLPSTAINSVQSIWGSVENHKDFFFPPFVPPVSVRSKRGCLASKLYEFFWNGCDEVKLTYRHSQLFSVLSFPLLSFFASLLSEEVKDKI